MTDGPASGGALVARRRIGPYVSPAPALAVVSIPRESYTLPRRIAADRATTGPAHTRHAARRGIAGFVKGARCMAAFSANRHGVLRLWCEGCEDWTGVPALKCSCGNVLELAGETWRVDGNGYLWVWCDGCDDWNAVGADSVLCDGCGDFLY